MIADRIKTFKRVKVADLIDNPRNWRKHPDAQRNALGGLLESVGWADAVLARETKDGLMLIDGHLRKELAKDSKVPVLVLDVTEAEADLILATHDPLTEMAETNQELLTELLEDVAIESELLALLEDKVGIFDVGCAEMPELRPDDERGLTSMNFHLSQSQNETVKRALVEAKKGLIADDENQNANGNALAFIAEAYLGNC